MKKIELHQHLDCSVSYDFAKLFEPSLTEAQFRAEFVAPRYSPDFGPYEACANRAVDLMQTTDALRASVDDLFRQLLADEIIYAEIRFAPLLHLNGGLTPKQVVTAVDDATRAASAVTGIDAHLILCTLRQYDEAQSLATARLCKDFAGSAVVGLDLAGDEIGYPIAAHVAAYAFARSENIARTAHAGEAGGPESVWETLELLQPQRLGHGVRSIEDPRLIGVLRERAIHLEVCVTSNVQTGVCETFAAHPIERLRAAGVAMSISTDGRTISDVTLTGEYRDIAATFGWTDEHFAACNRAAIDAAFASDAVKEKLRYRNSVPGS